MSAFQAEDDSSNLFIRSEYKLILVMLLFCYICLGFLFLLIIRNNFVASFWMRILDEIYAYDNYISLCKEFDKVSYASMVLKFYKPLKTKYWYSKKFYDIIK